MDRKQNKGSARRPCNPPKKRKFHGNIYSDEVGSSFASTSAEKLRSSKDDSFDVCCDDSASYCFIQFILVFSTLQNIVKCKQCNADVRFSKYGQRGFGFKIKIECLCDDRFINSGNMINNAYEVNRRFVYVMRLLGVGLQGIHIFCGLMDMGRGLHINAYYNIVHSILDSVSTVYDLVTKKAVREEKDLNVQAGYPENELSVSGNVSSSKRGFSSLLGIVSLIGKYSNKILDTDVKSTFCRACNLWKGKENSDGYHAWHEHHEAECQASHEGGTEKMEVDGIIETFRRSVEKYGVRYAYYIGDGVTETFRSFLEAAPYGDDFLVKKGECVLRVKKRLYRRAKEANKQLTLNNKARKQQEDEDGKSEAKSRRKSTELETEVLTNKLMQNLSLYYGLAISRHPDSIEEMSKAIWATYYHKISTDENPQHQYCPEGADSWCKWRQDEAAGTLASFSHPPALDADVAGVLKPIYEEYSQDNLLRRCLGSNTQNNNGSFNACVLHLAPRHVFCGKNILEIATMTAACIFNEGYNPILKIFEIMGCRLGAGSLRFAEDCNNAHVRLARQRSSEASKEARIARKESRSIEDHNYDEAEGILFAPGIAD